jgi:hypothetical protein
MVDLYRHLARVPPSETQHERRRAGSEFPMERHTMGDEEGKEYKDGI